MRFRRSSKSSSVASVAQGHEERPHVFDLLRREHGFTAKRRCNPVESVPAIIGRHDGVRIKYTWVDDPQPQLAFRVVRSGACQIGPNGALEFLLPQRRRMA